MSWDVSLVKENLEEVDCGNYTYNVASMYQKAMSISLSDLDGQYAADVSLILTNGIIEMTSNPQMYRDMNPENGWGNYEGAIQFIASIVRECISHPNSIVRIT